MLQVSFSSSFCCYKPSFPLNNGHCCITRKWQFLLPYRYWEYIARLCVSTPFAHSNISNYDTGGNLHLSRLTFLANENSFQQNMEIDSQSEYFLSFKICLFSKRSKMNVLCFTINLLEFQHLVNKQSNRHACSFLATWLTTWNFSDSYFSPLSCDSVFVLFQSRLFFYYHVLSEILRALLCCSSIPAGLPGCSHMSSAK